MRHKKASARILSLALSAAMVMTMIPTTVFAAEGDGVAPGTSSVGTIQSFGTIEGYTKSVPFDGRTYAITVKQGTPFEEVVFPKTLTAMVARTAAAPAEDEDVVDSGKVDEPAEDEVIPGEDETVSGNVASPSDAEQADNEEIEDDDIALAPEPEQLTVTEPETLAVTWHSDKEYRSDENGRFIYTAELPEGYIRADGVKLPQIYVFVGKQARNTPTGVVSIGDTGYDTLQEAFADVADGNTIKVLENINLTTGVTLSSASVSAILDLNGKAITFGGTNAKAAITVNSTASLTVTDSSDSKNGSITATDISGIAIQNNGSNTITITDGTIAANGNMAICNTGTGYITISGGTISAMTGYAIYNISTGTVAISQGEGKTTLITSASTTGTIYFETTSTSRLLSITGGTVSNTATPTAGYSVYFNGTTIDKLGTVYSKVGDATVGKIYPESSAITISTQPTSPAAMTYGTISGSLTVAGTASNNNTVSYQWYKNTTNSATGGTIIPGATSASYTIPTDLNAGTYYYYCVLKATDCDDKASNVATVTVSKATATSAMTTVAASVSKDGKTGATVTLPTKPARATYGTPADGNGTITFTNMSISGDTLTYTAPASTAGQTGTITIPVTTATNYNDYTITVTITSTDKTPVTISGLSAPSKTYDGNAITNTAFGTPSYAPTWTGTLEYTYYEGTGTGGTKLSGAPKNAGTYTVVAAIPDSDATHTGKKEITFTISQATVTIKAKDKSAYVGDTAPVLTSADCTITGLASGENLKTAPTVEYASTPDMSAAGTVTITAKDAEVPDGGNYNTTITYQPGTLTISKKSSGGGGGSSSSGSSPTTTTPTKDSLTNGQTTVTAPVDQNGNATVTVTDKAVADAIKAAQEQAKKEGLAGKLISVEIVATTDKAATQVTATLPLTVQKTLLDNKVDSVKITTSTVTMTFSQTAIQQINGQAKADVTITAAKSDTSKLTGDAKALIGNRPMFDFNATYNNGSKSITDFGGNTVSIAIPYTLGPGELPGNLYAIYVDGNSKATKMTNSSYDKDLQAVIFTTSHFSKYAVGYQASYNFTDIGGHWAKTDIEFTANRGLLTGISNTTFSPDAAMTRGMFVTALGRLAGIDPNSYKSGPFTDVPATTYYAPYVNWAASKGITNGTSTTTFSPDSVVTRQEMAVFMENYAKAMGYKVPETRAAVTFADNSSIGSWAANAVKQMQMAGIMVGKDGNRFDPTASATRAEVAAVLHRYVSLVIDTTTAQGFETNDSGSLMYYRNGKALTGAQTISGVAYSFNSYGEAKTAAPVAPAQPVDGKKYTIYTVKKNDWLSKIAAEHNCTVDELLALNNISNKDLIYQGQQIKVPQK